MRGPLARAHSGPTGMGRSAGRTAPDGVSVWQFGPAAAESAISGTAGDFCRVAARRLAPADSGLTGSGPHGATALRLTRTYAE
jgi:hypothetical protein